MILALSNLSSQAAITCAASSGVNRILLKPYNIIVEILNVYPEFVMVILSG